MRKNCFYMLTFQTTHDAIRTEKALKPYLRVIVMPVLRHVSASCGMALRIEDEDWPKLLELDWDRACTTPYHVGERVETVTWR